MIALVTGPGDGEILQAFLEEDPGVLQLPMFQPMDQTLALLRDQGATQVFAASFQALGRANELRSLLNAEHIEGVDAVQQPTAPSRIGIDTVSRNGSHVVSGIYEHRYVPRSGQLVLAERCLIQPGSTTEAKLRDAARLNLDLHRVTDGPAFQELDCAEGHPLLRLHRAPLSPAISADAAFSAMGQSHQHLFAESLLRAEDFRHRLNRDQGSNRRILAVSFIPRGGETGRLGKLDLARRLTGFHSIRRDPDILAVHFVHDDRDAVRNSLAVLGNWAELGASRGGHDSVFSRSATRVHP